MFRSLKIISLLLVGVSLSGVNDFGFVCICVLWSLKVLCLLFCLSFELFFDIICV